MRYGSDKSEFSIFANNHLVANGGPLSGATYSWRFPICDSSCFVPTYFQAGVGLSNAGPMAELAWSATPLWFARIDFTTQIFLGSSRAAIWSYPLWIGLSLPLSW